MKQFYLLLCLLSVSLFGYTQNPAIPDSISRRIQKVENSLSPLVVTSGEPLWNIYSQMKKYHIPGLSIAVIHNYQLEWAKGYGTTLNNTNPAVNTETAFQAASISKFVNAIAFTILADQGNVNLQTSISNYLTTEKFGPNPGIDIYNISLDQLLSHTAGLSVHGFAGYKNAENLPDIITILKGKYPSNSQKIKQLIPPGSKFMYSGGGITLSQHLLTNITKTSYERYLHTLVLSPLQMNNSFYSVEINKYPANIAFAQDDNGRLLKNKYNYYPESAAAGLWTTPTDLCKLIIAIQKSLQQKPNSVLSYQAVQHMTTPVLPYDIAALGIFTEDQNGERYLQHSGVNKGFRAKVYFSALNGNGVVIMSNGTNTKILDEIVRSVALTYNWPGFTILQSEIPATATQIDLQKLTGTYSLNNRKLTITLKNGKLIAKEKRKWSTILIPVNALTFVAETIKPQTTFTFVTNNQGNITKLVVNQGTPYEWERIKR